MKPVPPAELSHVEPIDGRSHGRTPQTQLLIDERDTLLTEATQFYPSLSRREVARKLHAALSIYRGGRWRRDGVQATCPMQHRGKLLQTMWMILKVRDHVPSETTIRRALGVVVIHDQ
jgi:hypothetical protein